MDSFCLCNFRVRTIREGRQRGNHRISKNQTVLRPLNFPKFLLSIYYGRFTLSVASVSVPGPVHSETLCTNSQNLKQNSVYFRNSVQITRHCPRELNTLKRQHTYYVTLLPPFFVLVNPRHRH